MGVFWVQKLKLIPNPFIFCAEISKQNKLVVDLYYLIWAEAASSLPRVSSVNLTRPSHKRHIPKSQRSSEDRLNRRRYIFGASINSKSYPFGLIKRICLSLTTSSKRFVFLSIFVAFALMRQVRIFGFILTWESCGLAQKLRNCIQGR